MKVTTVPSLKFAIAKFCLTTTLQIKRKTVTDAAGTVKRWCFVVHAPENVLLDLEKVWGQLQLQTGWKLEPCFKPLQLDPANSSPASESLPDLEHANSSPTSKSLPDVDPANSNPTSESTPPTSPTSPSSISNSFYIPSIDVSFFGQLSPPMQGTSVNSHVETDHRQGINILYYNAHSLLPKIDELRLVCEVANADIICVVETWLNSDIANNELWLPNYQLHRRDRDRHGGGIALCISDTLVCKPLLYGGPDSLEFISVSVSSIIFSENLCLCLFYCPPSSPVFTFNKLCTILHLLNPVQFSNCLIVGDFNINFLDQKSYSFSYVRDILDSFSFSQIVPSFTHVSPSGTKSLIDLALLLRTEHLQHCTTVSPLSTSDHLGVSIPLQWKLRPADPMKSRKVWLYKQGDYLKAQKCIAETDWNSILSSDDIDIVATRWTDMFLTIMEQCIPTRYLPTKHNLPWLTSHIMKCIRKRTSLFRRAKKSKKTSDMLQYKKMRNKVVKLLRHSKQKFISNIAHGRYQNILEICQTSK